MPVPVAEKTIGNKNKLVCKMVNPKTFDRIENTAGYQIFFGKLARPNLRTITLAGDFLMYGEKKVSSYAYSKWSVDRQVPRGAVVEAFFEQRPNHRSVLLYATARNFPPRHKDNTISFRWEYSCK